MKTSANTPSGLERSCGPEGMDWVRIAPSDGDGCPERIEARFKGHAYDPHRHDSYAIGSTVTGVQSFDYRGETRHSLPGHSIILHPDEAHDGRAGEETGFLYRMLYIDPKAIGDALDGQCGSLPFVSDGLSTDPALAHAVHVATGDMRLPMEPLAWMSAIADIANALAALDPSLHEKRQPPADTQAVHRAKEAMLASLEDGISLTDLEVVSGQSRYALTRHFRAICGVSPHRWLVMRRLERARKKIEAGISLADAATDTGFADQSHMTRHFKSAYGVSPGVWRRCVAASSGSP